MGYTVVPVVTASRLFCLTGVVEIYLTAILSGEVGVKVLVKGVVKEDVNACHPYSVKDASCTHFGSSL